MRLSRRLLAGFASPERDLEVHRIVEGVGHRRPQRGVLDQRIKGVRRRVGLDGDDDLDGLEADGLGARTGAPMDRTVDVGAEVERYSDVISICLAIALAWMPAARQAPKAESSISKALASSSWPDRTSDPATVARTGRSRM